MTDDIELVHGSGNVFRDLGRPNANIEHTKARLAAKIIGVLEERNLSTRQAQALTGIDHSEFTRIRRVNLDRFTIDRLINILNRLCCEVEVRVRVKSMPKENHRATG